ncbi:kinase-like protein [Gymnopus androsaceus JB14]|uniref:Kinase-like protein n=1 Tax=Gymnopus androsaceus JB14 TaxID=1447944 RepID=A0A6A4IDB0_9AGAR|nr:kinase-like protein [Gymnopus androsaceus JB14]
MLYPPLSAQASKKSPIGKDNSDYFRHNNDPSSVNNKRVHRDSLSNRPSYAFSTPLSVTTNLLSSPTSSSPALPSKPLRSPYISSRQTLNPVFPASPSPSQSLHSLMLEDVFVSGDIIGEGATLQGETITLVSIGDAVSFRSDTPDYEKPAKEFEVVRRLGAGSYAVVYLVCEVLYRPPSEDGHMVGAMDLDDTSRPRPSTVYGREYALKCLSKANLDEDALAAQMSEVTIHQSLHSHPNIVTLHRTLETSSFLLLLLEYVPGEDLFYFLEQSRDHCEIDSPDSSTCSSRTPPTPSLLSNMNPAQQLSRTRLRLISSMFSQMCDAVAACHDQHVFHRDIKPENFIVTDARHTREDGTTERKVVVKLTDFGLSTTDAQSSDMDCGSAPYMSYECRNNVAPTYSPRAADVWSLGIVLINMLYHCNPWTDTAQGACSTFDLFLRDPVSFFMYRFSGMTQPVAEVLANRVFNVLDDPEDDSKRISASGFGTWIRDLPDLLSDDPKPRKGHQRNVSISSFTQGFSISASTPMSHRPQSRQASGSTTAVRTPAIPSRSLSRAPSLGPAYEHPETSELSTVFDQEVEVEELEARDDRDHEDAADVISEVMSEEGMHSRSQSAHKRRKRGARKGKGAVATPTTPKDETLATLAVASQSLARELSKTSKLSGRSDTSSTAPSSSSRRSRPYEPVSMYPLPTPLLSTVRPLLPPAPPSVSAAASNAPASAPVSKKASKWKLSFGKASAAALASGALSHEDGSSMMSASAESSMPMSTTANNVKTLIMGLEARPLNASSTNLNDDISTFDRGRRNRGSPPRPYRDVHNSRSPMPPRSPHRERWTDDRRSERAISPNSTRSGRPLASSASSVASGNWRSSMSTTSNASMSSSAFTRYSNSSVRSVSTAATSVSSNSWRTNGKYPPSSSSSYHASHPGLPKNVKIMDGVPGVLTELPRGQRPDPVGEMSNGPRKQRSRKPKELSLGTINERPALHSASSQKSPGFGGREAGASTADLSSTVSNSSSQGDSDGPKKVQKGQINALAKMLSALRR